jgi:hypothetical protein
VSDREELLTISEIVERFKVAGIGGDDHSRRSYIRELITTEPPKLEDRLELPAGRRRAGKGDRRITKKSVDAFLGSNKRPGAGGGSSSQERPQDGRTAISELLARIELLEQERNEERERRAEIRKQATEELHQQGLRVLELKKQARLTAIDLDLANEALDEVRGTRATLESVIIDLKWDGNVDEISGGA